MDRDHLMTDTEVQQSPAEPVVLEHGRYRLFESPDGGWVVARAVETCETCQNCGCGEQAEPIMIPAMVVKMARAQHNGGLLGKLKAVTGLARDNG
jgi:hypothetical protein